MWVGIGVGIGRTRFATGIFNAYALRVTADGGITEAGQCVDAVTGILLNASLLLIPSGYKGGKLYAEIPTNGNGDLTWTRGGDAFRTNASGVIQRVPWNLVQQSETFSNAYWTKSNTTISADTTTAPNGTLTADTLIEDTTNSTHRIFNNSAVTVSNTIATTYSVYLKSAGRTRAWVRDNDLLGALFNLSTGTIVSTDSGVTASITNFGDSWYRCTITKVSSSVSGRIVVYLDNGTSDTYTGNGTSGIYIWGAQLVEGSSAQTYFPTTDRLNVPRLSYMYGSCPAVLAEPQRTNLVLQSNTFNTTWQLFAGATITPNSTTSPDGSTNATTLNSAGGGNDFLFQSFTVTNAITYTVSFYIKNVNSTQSKFYIPIAAFPEAFINWSGSIITSVASSGTNSFTAMSNGWYRVSVTATATATGTYIFRIYSDNNNTSKSVYIYGAQLEAGAFQTTYIPTTSATATRVADSFSRNNIYTNGLISASGGTWFLELRNNVAYLRDSSSGFGIGDSSSLGTNSIFLRLDQLTSARLAIIKRLAGIPYPLYYTTTDTVKIAIKWNGTSADIFVNGVKEISATTFTTTNMDFLAVGSALGVGVPIFIQQMALFNSPLTDAQCQTLTT